MTASIVTPAAASAATVRLAGFGALVRKERTEWLRGRRAWIVMIVTTLIMALLASVSWLNTTLRAMFPSDDAVDPGPISLDPVDNSDRRLPAIHLRHDLRGCRADRP
jgi:hypothetical protein